MSMRRELKKALGSDYHGERHDLQINAIGQYRAGSQRVYAKIRRKRGMIPTRMQIAYKQ